MRGVRCVGRCVTVLALAALGCGGDTDDDAVLLQQTGGVVISLDGGVRDAGAVRPYEVQLSASGSGCPEGSRSVIWRDDDSVIITLLKFDLAVDRNTSSQERECTVTLKVASARPLSYRLERPAFLGYAFLEPGTSAVAELSWDPPLAKTPLPQRFELAGPYDDTYALFAGVSGEAVRAQCGTEVTLNFVTKLTLSRQPDGGTGYLNVTSLDDADGAARIRFRLRSVPCTPRVP